MSSGPQEPSGARILLYGLGLGLLLATVIECVWWMIVEAP